MISAVLVSCKENKNDTEENEVAGKYEAVLIDVRNTEIPGDIDPDVLMEDTLLADMNLTEKSQFWGEKKDFALFAMGSIKFPESGLYYFRLTSTGKITFKLNNKDLVVNTAIHDTETNNGEAYLDTGSSIFEYEYYPAFKEPYLVLEWSKDGKTYEVVPTEAFDNLDAFSVANWEGETSETEEGKIPDNTLSEKEKEEGWQLLFDGSTTEGWHTYNKPGQIGRKWKAENGALVFEGRPRFEFYVSGRKIELGPTDKAADGGQDIIYATPFENFELKMDWWISEAGNSGIFYTVQSDTIYDEIWKTSPEMQVMDNAKHKDGLINKHRAGDLYDLIAANPIRVKKQGEWNSVKIVKNQGKIEHWMNGIKVLEYDLNSETWKDMFSKSKFKDLNEYASKGPGHIGIQDHDNEVHYKNIKIRVLE
ncbi:MAG: DUF1080 domain-containing protein [Bacteroidia bacterium]|nr:DUF1080 domain-containing protein [Bacteroidia bacterium]